MPSSVCGRQFLYSLERTKSSKPIWPGVLLQLCESSSRTGGLSLRTGIYSGSRYSFSEMPLTKIRRSCSTDIISGFVKLESVASFSLTWNICFYYHTCISYLFAGTWIATWSRHSRVLRSGEYPIMHLFPSAIVGRSSSYFQVRWSKSSQQAKLLSKLQLLSAGSWRWRVNYPSLTFGRHDGCTRWKLLGGWRWSASSLRSWRNHCSNHQGCALQDHSEPLSLRNILEV